MFRRFVFTVYAGRIADLLMLIEEVAFGRVDMRLAQTLLAHARRDGSGATVTTTHQSLATELGTAREVVSRQLKEFERRRLGCAVAGAYRNPRRGGAAGTGSLTAARTVPVSFRVAM